MDDLENLEKEQNQKSYKVNKLIGSMRFQTFPRVNRFKVNVLPSEKNADQREKKQGWCEKLTDR